MTNPSSDFTEDALVQRTTAEYLERELDWESVYAHNREDFGPDGQLGRGSDREVVLTRPLRAQLARLNPGLPEEAYDDAVRQLTDTRAAHTIVAANREQYALIRDGVPVAFRNAAGDRVRERLRVLDFETPERNHFLCVRELWVRGDLYRRRADLVGFVNGLPLLFVECKHIHRNLQAAFEENYADYRDTIPHLFHHNAVVLFGNGAQAKIGSVTSRWEHFHEWKRLEEEEPGAVDMETLLKGVCAKRTFIDLVENFILFDESGGEVRKILARNHQFLGVNRAVAAVRDRKARRGRLGVFWHTQRAGKSYSIVLFTRKVHRKLGGNFTFLVLTDREDLDAQIYKTFAGCGVVDHDRDPCRASSGTHLGRLLGEHKSYVFSLIQKFNQDVDPDAGYTQRDDVIVVTDEAHRTQYGTLALNMRNALPNASYIGFTGTPLFSDDEITRRVFGDYVSTYDFQRAVEDQATLPLYYDARGDKLGVAVGDLNARIADKLEEFESGDIDVEQRLERELRRDYHIMTAGARLDQVARDFVTHYSAAWETGKAMLVCIDKLTCVRMHRLIEFYWHERIRELEAEQPPDEEEAATLRRRIAWMHETRAAVVVSEEQGEVDKFRRWDLDITPHRRLLKQGMDLPDSLRRQPRFRTMQRMAPDDAFKEAEHPFRIAIVCAMWLTGFDVPSLSTLYLDKPLKAHALMQAIARANRVHEGKTNGLIVDYCGILAHLRAALATFAGPGSGSRDGEAHPAKPAEELLVELADAVRLARDFLYERRTPLDDVLRRTGFKRNAAILACQEAVNENDETRKQFEVTCREVFRKFKACLNVHGVNTYRADCEALGVIYRRLHQDRDRADISAVIRQLHAVVDAAIDVQPHLSAEGRVAYDVSRIDFDRLKQEFARSRTKHTTVQTLKDAVEKKLRRLLAQNPVRTDFQRHYEEVVAGYNREKDRLTIEQTFEALLRLAQDLDDEERRAVREGLDEESLAIFDLLKKPDLSAPDIARIKRVAVELLRTLKAEKLRIDRWREKETTRAAVHVTIRDFLWDEQTGLPDDSYSDDDVGLLTDDVFRHVFRVYPNVPSPYYEHAAAA